MVSLVLPLPSAHCPMRVVIGQETRLWRHLYFCSTMYILNPILFYDYDFVCVCYWFELLFVVLLKNWVVFFFHWFILSITILYFSFVFLYFPPFFPVVILLINLFSFVSVIKNVLNIFMCSWLILFCLLFLFGLIDLGLQCECRWRTALEIRRLAQANILAWILDL